MHYADDGEDIRPMYSTNIHELLNKLWNTKLRLEDSLCLDKGTFTAKKYKNDAVKKDL